MQSQAPAWKVAQYPVHLGTWWQHSTPVLLQRLYAHERGGRASMLGAANPSCGRSSAQMLRLHTCARAPPSATARLQACGRACAGYPAGGRQPRAAQRQRAARGRPGARAGRGGGHALRRGRARRLPRGARGRGTVRSCGPGYPTIPYPTSIYPTYPTYYMFLPPLQPAPLALGWQLPALPPATPATPCPIGTCWCRAASQGCPRCCLDAGGPSGRAEDLCLTPWIA